MISKVTMLVMTQTVDLVQKTHLSLGPSISLGQDKPKLGSGQLKSSPNYLMILSKRLDESLKCLKPNDY